MNHSFQSIQEEIRNMLELSDEELTDEQRATLDAYLDELGQQEADKIDAFCQFIRIESARAKAIREEAAYLSKRARAAENRISGLKEHYMRTMLFNGLSKVAGNTHKISLVKSKSVHVDEDAIDILPVEFLKIERSPIKTAIKSALESGKEIAGCSIVETQSLRVS